VFSPVERMLAFRYLRARKQEGFVSVVAGFSFLGILLGVGTLIIVMSVMNGFRQELLGRILGLNGHLGLYGSAGPIPDYEALAARVRGLPGVVAATPIVEGQVLATGDRGGGVGVLVRGIAPADLKTKALVAGNIRGGSLDGFEGNDAAVIGTRLAQRLGIQLGGRITLISPEGQVTAFGTVPRLRAYRVAALFEVGMYEYDSSFVFLPIDAAQAYFRTGEAASQVEVFVEDPVRIERAVAGLRIALQGQNLRLVDWQQSNSSFFNAVQVERNVMFLILTLIILVAAFNIVSSMIMLVKEKGRDIAVLRTMGATRGTILRVFLLCGSVIGVLGTLVGTGVALLFCRNIESIRQWLQGLTGTELFSAEIYFLSRLPAIVDWGEVTTVVAMGLGLSLAATVYPALRASRLDPVEALRYE